jgi:chromosome segregation ATPase
LRDNLRIAMSFTVTDFDDLIQLLDSHPDWRDALRRRVLGDDYLSLPDAVRELIAAQRKTDEHVDQLTQRVDQLTQRVDQLTQRVDQLTQRVDQLTQRVDQLTQRVDQLTQRVDQLTQRVDQLTQRLEQFIASTDKRLSRLEDDSARLKGMILEQQYAARPYVYFKDIIRRARTLSSDELYDLIESSPLTEDQTKEILSADVIAAGRIQKGGDTALLVAEVSWGIGPDDVKRAMHRAELLAQIGRETIPVVAGDWITPEALSLIEKQSIWYVIGGRAIR